MPKTQSKFFKQTTHKQFKIDKSMHIWVGASKTKSDMNKKEKLDRQNSALTAKKEIAGWIRPES